MAVLTVVIDDIFPASDTSMVVNYRWFAINGPLAEVDSASEEFPIQSNAAQMNAAVIARAVVLAGNAGVTILSADRKMLVGGMS